MFFLLGLPMCTTGGLHLFNIFDQRCSSSLLLLVLVEVSTKDNTILVYRLVMTLI